MLEKKTAYFYTYHSIRLRSTNRQTSEQRSLGMQVCVKGFCVGSSQLCPDKQKKKCLTKKWRLTGQDCYDLHLKLIVCLLNTCKLQLWFINTNKVFCKLLWSMLFTEFWHLWFWLFNFHSCRKETSPIATLGGFAWSVNMHKNKINQRELCVKKIFSK